MDRAGILKFKLKKKIKFIVSLSIDNFCLSYFEANQKEKKKMEINGKERNLQKGSKNQMEFLVFRERY